MKYMWTQCTSDLQSGECKFASKTMAKLIWEELTGACVNGTVFGNFFLKNGHIPSGSKNKTDLILAINLSGFKDVLFDECGVREVNLDWDEILNRAQNSVTVFPLSFFFSHLALFWFPCVTDFCWGMGEISWWLLPNNNTLSLSKTLQHSQNLNRG